VTMSVNGKPFKNDPTSYQMTGIPCGNPARYLSRGVTRMPSSHSTPFENQQIGIPGKGTESAAEEEVRHMVKNQLNPSAEYARKTLNFTSPTSEKMVGSAKGFMTLAQFQKISEEDIESNQMRGLGYTDHLINHHLAQKGMREHPNRKRKIDDDFKFTPHPDFILRGIQEMVEAKERKKATLEDEANFQPLQKMSRHRAELESSILQNKQHPLASMYHKKAQGSNKDDYTPVISASEEIEEWEDTRDDDDNTSPISDTLSPLPTPLPASIPILSTPAAPPKPVVLSQKIESLAKDSILAKKATEEDISNQFPNYEKGNPSKVLFVKNLDKGVGVEDLVSMFIRFQEEGKDKISFKLLTSGKMKGQAFITFHDEPAATSALELVHGFIFKGDKPVIIQYGKPNINRNK